MPVQDCPWGLRICLQPGNPFFLHFYLRCLVEASPRRSAWIRALLVQQFGSALARPRKVGADHSRGKGFLNCVPAVDTGTQSVLSSCSRVRSPDDCPDRCQRGGCALASDPTMIALCILLCMSDASRPETGNASWMRWLGMDFIALEIAAP